MYIYIFYLFIHIYIYIYIYIYWSPAENKYFHLFWKLESALKKLESGCERLATVRAAPERHTKRGLESAFSQSPVCGSLFETLCVSAYPRKQSRPASDPSINTNCVYEKTKRLHPKKMYMTN